MKNGKQKNDDIASIFISYHLEHFNTPAKSNRESELLSWLTTLDTVDGNLLTITVAITLRRLRHKCELGLTWLTTIDFLRFSFITAFLYYEML